MDIKKIPIHFDLETSDPDDIMTLAVLATHPRAALKSVTITPGGFDQVDLVYHVLNLLDRADVLVGAGTPKKTGKFYVSEFHYHWLGKPQGKITNSVLLANDAIQTSLKENPDLVLLTGAKLTNIAEFLSQSELTFAGWFGQGGFAGDNLVPPEYRLAKFAGRQTCPTFNFNADVKAAHLVLNSKIPRKVLISKNVCHGLAWNADFHHEMGLVKRTPGLELVYQGMEKYLKRHPEGKLLHDPLAAMVMLSNDIVETRPVDVYRASNGEWGCHLNADSAVSISISANHQKFASVLVEN